MHDYSIDKHPKEKIIFFLSYITILIFPFITFAINKIGVSINILSNHLFVIPAFSIPIFTIFLLVYFGFEKYLWKIKYFRKIFLVPDLNGIWEVTGITVFRNGEKDAIQWKGEINIQQSWSKIIIALKTSSSKSESISASIISKDGAGYLLVYSYENRPNIDSENLKYHIGLVSIEINTDCNSGDGEYFTNHTRQTSGKLEWLKRNDKK